MRNLQNSIFSLVGHALFAIGLTLVRSRGLNVSWRVMLGVTTVFLNFVDMPFVFLTVFDVVRNQYFYLGETVLIEVPAAANFVVSTCANRRRCSLPLQQLSDGRHATCTATHRYSPLLTATYRYSDVAVAVSPLPLLAVTFRYSYVMVEMAESGNEGLVYGLLTTTNNLGGPLGNAIGNYLFGAFTPSLSDSANYIVRRSARSAPLPVSAPHPSTSAPMLLFPLLSPRHRAHPSAHAPSPPIA